MQYKFSICYQYVQIDNRAILSSHFHRGLFYLVVIEENKPKEIVQLFRNMEFESTVILSRRTGPELLSVIKFWRM